MIFDNISNFSKYASIFPEVHKFLNNNDYTQLAPGKHFISDDLYVLSNEYESNKSDSNILENHHTNVDIHLILSGVEKFKYVDSSKLMLSKEYDAENDYELYEQHSQGNTIVLIENQFVVFFPGEAHLPGLAAFDNVSSIRKLVFKVKYFHNE